MTNPVSGEYHNRTTGLIIFGILEIVMGALSLLMAVTVLLGGLLAGHAGGEMPLRALIPGVGVYVLVGIVAIWLGIGSMLARRWARALWLCVSGVGLVLGLVSIPFGAMVAANLPRQMAASGQPQLPPAGMVVVQVVVIGIMAFFYVIIPGALFLFYRSPQVKHTCETRDPQEGWTDRCPLPVLALSLFTAFSGFGMLFLIAYGGVFPLFGTYATGALGCALALVGGGVMLGLARGLYRLRIGAWWGVLAFMLIMTISGTVTLWHADLGELYARMGFDSRMTAASTQFGQMSLMRWMAPVWVIPWVGWLLYVRRYFRVAPGAGVPAPKP